MNTFTVKRAATIDRTAALEALVAKYPDHDIASFATQTEDGREFYVATLKLAEAEFPPSAPEEKADEQAETEETPKAENEAPKESPEGSSEPKEKSEGGESKGGTGAKLDEIIKLIHELLGDAPAPAPHAAPEGGPHGGPMPGERPLPPPVQPHNKLDALQKPLNAPAFASKRSHIVARADGAEVTLKQAVAELYQEYGQYGYKVAKIERKGSNIVAAIVKKAWGTEPGAGQFAGPSYQPNMNPIQGLHPHCNCPECMRVRQQQDPLDVGRPMGQDELD